MSYVLLTSRYGETIAKDDTLGAVPAALFFIFHFVAEKYCLHEH